MSLRITSAKVKAKDKKSNKIVSSLQNFALILLFFQNYKIKKGIFQICLIKLDQLFLMQLLLVLHQTTRKETNHWLLNLWKAHLLRREQQLNRWWIGLWNNPNQNKKFQVFKNIFHSMTNFGIKTYLISIHLILILDCVG